MRWQKLYRQQKGIARRYKGGGNKKQPLTPTMLINFKRWLDKCPPGQAPQYAALWAMCLVAFFGYFRKSNVATKTTSPFSDGKCIRYCDVRVDVAQYALAITPPGSKTRQFGAAPTVWVAGQRGHPLDPVAAWADHISKNGAPDCTTLSAFTVVGANGSRSSMAYADLVQAAKVMAELSGSERQSSGRA